MARGFVKLVAVVILASGAGLALGLGVSKLSGGSGAPTPATDTRAGVPTTSAGLPPTTATGSSNTAGRPAPAGTATGPTPAPRDPSRFVTVRVLSAVLHPAATPVGQSRLRARLTVRVLAANRGTLLVTPSPPVLLVGGARVQTDPRADAASSGLGRIEPGARADALLQFEVAGAVTTQLRAQQGGARVLVAGRALPVTVTVGPPVGVQVGSG